MRLDPQAASNIANRGIVQLRLNHVDQAVADFDEALKIDTKSANALYGRGLAKRRKGDRAAGDADISAAKAIETSIAERFAHYGIK